MKQPDTRHYALCFAAATWVLNSFSKARAIKTRGTEESEKVLLMSVVKSEAKMGWNGIRRVDGE